MERNMNGPANMLLRTLEPEAYRRLAPKLKKRTLRPMQVLYYPNQPIGEVYFPETAVICLMSVMANGDTLETATVGLEGASWISARIGASSMPFETVVAIGGNALVLSIEALDTELKQNEPFRDVLTRYSHALLIHSMRMTACTGLHSLEQRAARWILATVDRVGNVPFSVTHELLARLLGSTRPSLSVVLEAFQKRGLLATRYGRLSVTDRSGLVNSACECYEIIKENYRQVGR